MINYQKSLNFAKELGLDLEKLKIWENLSKHLPFSQMIYEAGKLVGGIHLNFSETKVSEENLIELNYFDLEFRSKTKMSLEYSFRRFFEDYQTCSLFVGYYLEHFCDATNMITLRDLIWKTQESDCLPFVVISNLDVQEQVGSSSRCLLMKDNQIEVEGNTFEFPGFAEKYGLQKKDFAMVLSNTLLIREMFLRDNN